MSGPDWIWYVKYLSANDTYAKPNVHQGGPYVAKPVLRVAFAGLAERATREDNPDVTLPVSIDSHAGFQRDVRLVWYNSRRLGQRNGRDEARLTRWGSTDAPIVAAEATGSLVVFAYHCPPGHDADGCRIWIVRDLHEEDAVLDRVGPVEPGEGMLFSLAGRPLVETPVERDKPCHLTDATMPDAWKLHFPTGDEIVQRVVASLVTAARELPDRRVLRRRECEYVMFRSLEDFHVLPRIQEGFATVGLFVEFAHHVTNRRKSRSGKSLELQLRAIFDEEGLEHSWGEATESKRRPDFLFPSIAAYRDPRRRDDALRMLGVKTTVKDRWRQILNEAARVEHKHLFTLQHGVSVDQHREMVEEGVILVVPQPLHEKYPEEIRPQLMTLAGFISGTRERCAP